MALREDTFGALRLLVCRPLVGALLALDYLTLLNNLSVAWLVPLDSLAWIIHFGEEQLVVAPLQATELVSLVAIAHGGQVRILEYVLRIWRLFELSV